MISQTFQEDSSSPSPASESDTFDQILDRQLQQLLLDLQLYVPYDVAAVWLGHDDHPALRVVYPDHAVLPSTLSPRHFIFQTTAEAARIADLHSQPDIHEGDLRCWLGVPLVLHGMRRGWVEMLSTQPNRFSDTHLRQAETLVRYAALGLAQLEVAAHTRHEMAAQRHMLRGIEAALLAPSLRDTFQALLGEIVTASEAVAGTLMLPTELAYGLGFNQAVPPPPDAGPIEDERLMTVVAQWPQPDPAGQPDPAAGSAATMQRGEAGLVLPFIHEHEALGWAELYYTTPLPFGVVEPAALQQISAIVTALMVWLREQIQCEQQAQQSVRMLVQHIHQMRSSAISDLVEGLAHELQNPISAIIGLASLLRRDPTLPEAADSDAQAIIAEAQRVGEFVKRLSNFGHTSAMTKVPVKLNEVVGDTLAVVKGLTQQRQVALHCRLPEESPVVLGNRAQLQQVCLDLLNNALDAIETSDEPEITVEVGCEGQWALVRIGDNGYGIPEDLRDRIFAPGFTTKTSGGMRRGLGIGLPIALDIVRNHWGTITVTSQIWEGSCFTMRLPQI
ncbi:MAG TPA: GAF domain-containing sensor histidine kinase [Herpetosiphonaceae bacterium]